MSGFELASTGATLNILIPIIAAVLLLAGVAAIVIPRLRRGARKAQAEVVDRPALEQDEVVQAEIVEQSEITQEPSGEDRQV